MKSIKQQYIDLREGNMSQANFMRSIRLSLPQYVTNITSFNDSVKILKNKGILTEADMNMDSSELAMGIKVEMEHTEDMAVAKKIAMDHLAENPKYYSELKVSGTEKPQATSNEPGSPIKNISSDDVMSLDVNLNRANPRDGFTLGFYEGKESAQITPEAIEVALENIWEEGLIDTVTWKTASKALPNFDIDGNTNMVGTSTADDLARELVFVATGNNVPDIVDYDDEEYNKAAEDDFDINMRVDQERENRFNENKSLSEGFDEDGENHSISIENDLEDRYSKGEITQQTLDNALDYVADHDYDLWADSLDAEYVLQQPGVRESLREAKDLSSEGKWKTVTGKQLYSQFKEIDNLNGQEVLIGIDFEMIKNPELSKLEAAKIVVKNLKKNSIYYTAQDMSGVEGYEIGYIGGKSADAEARQMQYLDKNMGNVVDKKMGMKPVKDVEKVKKDSNKGGETNKTVKGVSSMSLVAKSVRGLQKMDATGEKIKKITMKEGMENDEVAFENLMKKYDWYAEMSDDSRKWDAQQDMERQLKQIAKTISAEKAVEIWNRYAPENNRKVDTSFFEMRENKVAKTIFDKNANITKGINNIAKGEDNKKKLKEYLKEMIRKEIAGAYGGDAMDAEDGSSYINKD